MTLFNDFLESSRIAFTTLPVPIQKKINIYEHINHQLEDTIDEDKKTLERKLSALEEEIFEDLLNEFEDHLVNNELTEQEPEVKPGPKDPNVQVLENLYNEGHTDNLSRSFLKKHGLQLDFSQWEIPIGPFRLRRKSIFTIQFRLVKTG